MSSSAPRLLVDLQTVQGGFFGNRGIRRYSIGLARALVARNAAHALLFNPNRPWIESAPDDLTTSGLSAWTSTPQLRDLDDDGATAYLTTSPFERTRPVQSAVPPYVTESGLPVVAVLYDLIPEIVDVYPRSLMAAYWARRQLLQQADLLLTLSEHVRGDAIARLGVEPGRVAVIGASVSEGFQPPFTPEQPPGVVNRRLPDVSRPFVLCVTAWSPHKNVGALIDAWSLVPRRVRDAHQLVVTCKLPPQAGSSWPDRARANGLGPDDVVVTDYVDDEVLLALYQSAELFVLPSMQEGFGLTALEAARCGCPVITSSATSLPEVLDWPPATFPADDTGVMAEHVERALTDEEFRSRLRAVGQEAARRHTWEAVAERAIHACATMPAPRRPRRTPPRRLALVGRFDPPGSAIVGAVAQRLEECCHVDRFAPGRGSGRARGGRQYPLRALGRAFDPWGYDAIVYVVDRHPPPELLDLANRHPGIVWCVEAPDDPSVAAGLASGARGRVVSTGNGDSEVEAILEFASEGFRAPVDTRRST